MTSENGKGIYVESSTDQNPDLPEIHGSRDRNFDQTFLKDRPTI